MDAQYIEHPIVVILIYENACHTAMRGDQGQPLLRRTVLMDFGMLPYLKYRLDNNECARWRTAFTYCPRGGAHFRSSAAHSVYGSKDEKLTLIRSEKTDDRKQLNFFHIAFLCIRSKDRARTIHTLQPFSGVY